MEIVCSSETLVSTYQTTWVTTQKTTIGTFTTMKTLSFRFVITLLYISGNSWDQTEDLLNTKLVVLVLRRIKFCTATTNG
jgi:hypothetical protein